MPTGPACGPDVTRIGLGVCRGPDTVDDMADQSSSASAVPGILTADAAGQGSNGGYRIEHDTMGEVRVPAAAQVPGADPARGGELPDLAAAAWSGRRSARWR